MSADPIDDLAERLFASARGERASERLVQRVLSKVASADARRSEVLRPASARRARTGRRMARVLLAVAACAVAGVVWSALEPARPAPSISAELGPRERERPGAREHVDAPTTPAPAFAPAPSVSQHPAAPESAPHAATPSAPSAPLRRRASPDTARLPTPRGAAPLTVHEPAQAPPGTTAVDPSASDTVTPPAPSLSDELQALERARAALRGGDGRSALSLLDGDGQATGFTRLAAEATLLRIEALYAVGELAESRRLAHEFTTQNPDSHLVDRAQSFIRRVDASRNATGSRSVPR
jgi:hypothetical protein